MIYNGKRSGYTAKDISKLSFRPPKGKRPDRDAETKKRGKNGFLFYNQNVVHGMSRRENHEKPLHNSWKSKALLSLSLEKVRESEDGPIDLLMAKVLATEAKIFVAFRQAAKR